MPKYKYCDERENNKDTVLQSDAEGEPHYMSEEEAAGWVKAGVLKKVDEDKTRYQRKDVRAEA